ncbi:hypothetical protein JBKA6_1357 [Ichthyobacterium seriolicida]|uniref:DUF5018 domain-containing protein n=2 Tax=Ichthyobacterium seriolicida TaxID=242600 RepID=A0A1J1DZM1_9FLAO|nr:hypothetical protein JBKA6_1357 [Ichthyobacterium seriolicida]
MPIPEGIRIEPPVTEVQDFRTPVKYTITDKNGKSKEYTLTVNPDYS